MRGSMVISEVIEPYAEALMSLAKSNDLTDRIGDDIRSLVSLLENSEELRLLLSSPLVNDEEKKNLLQTICRDELHPYTLSILKLLVDRRRIRFLEAVGKEYLSLLRQLKQTVLAEVTSAVEINDHQRHQVSEKVKAMTGAHQVELETRIDPDLIGGVIIKVGSQVIDASLRGQLRRIGLSLGSAA